MVQKSYFITEECWYKARNVLTRWIAPRPFNVSMQQRAESEQDMVKFKRNSKQAMSYLLFRVGAGWVGGEGGTKANLSLSLS